MQRLLRVARTHARSIYCKSNQDYCKVNCAINRSMLNCQLNSWRFSILAHFQGFLIGFLRISRGFLFKKKRIFNDFKRIKGFLTKRISSSFFKNFLRIVQWFFKDFKSYCVPGLNRRSHVSIMTSFSNNWYVSWNARNVANVVKRDKWLRAR